MGRDARRGPIGTLRGGPWARRTVDGTHQERREADADRDALEEADRDRPDGRGDRDHEVEPHRLISCSFPLDQAKGFIASGHPWFAELGGP
jgi:hypothetical protein